MTAIAVTGGAAKEGVRTPGSGPWLWLAIGAVVLGLAVLAATSRPEGKPFDPDSTSKFGTRAFVELLEHQGAEVQVTDQQPPQDADIAVAFPHTISTHTTDALRRWVADGKTLIVADPLSDLLPPALGTGFGQTLETSVPVQQGFCDVGAVRDAKQLRIPVASAQFPSPSVGQECYSDESSAFLVVVPEGSGHIVGLGSPMVFANTMIGDDDNAVLAVALAVPRRGTKVAILELPQGESPPTGVMDVLGTGVKLGLLQLIVAFVIYAFFRGRRLGRPVHEPLPVQLEGSELVTAVSGLLQQAKSPDRAAALLRSAFRRQVTERLGLPPGVSPTVMAETVAARTGVDVQRVVLAVTDLPVGDEAGLVALAQSIDSLREELFHGLGV